VLLDRTHDADRLRDALAFAPVVVLTGPRQAGKSTLARQVVHPDAAHVFDLEDARDVERLRDPMLALEDLRDDTVVIDEAQRRPDLFPALRVLVDQNRRPGRFLVLGSASPDLVGLASESLAGRVELLELPGLRVSDADDLDRLWLRGGLPPSYLALDDEASARWRDAYIDTLVERDLAALGIRVPATTMRRFWAMLAHYHGQTWNGSELARSLEVSHKTVKSYLDALTDALVVRQLTPWYVNIGKRQVRAPKVYVRDTGLLHRLLGITDRVDLLRHPKLGASWEGFVIEQLVGALGARYPAFWGTQAGAELDLRLELRRRVVGVEVKRTDTPRLTPSIRHALADLELDHLYVVHAGPHRFRLAENVTAVPAHEALVGNLDG
jgi:hypothetical protein